MNKKVFLAEIKSTKSQFLFLRCPFCGLCKHAMKLGLSMLLNYSYEGIDTFHLMILHVLSKQIITLIIMQI